VLAAIPPVGRNLAVKMHVIGTFLRSLDASDKNEWEVLRFYELHVEDARNLTLSRRHLRPSGKNAFALEDEALGLRR
jgi:hypothetical protein